MTTQPRGVESHAPYQWLGLGIGAVYVLLAILGFFITGFDGFAEHDEGRTLLGFAVNPLHNIVHLLLGALGVAMWRTARGSRTYGWVLVVGYGLASAYGFAVAGSEDGNILNINAADNVLHVVSTLAGLAIALWPDRGPGAA